jgi:hypothetical protein
MNRLAVALLTLALIAGPLAGEGQPAGRVYRIGILLSGGTAPNPTGPNPGLLEFDAFIHRMHELGYVLGQDLAIDTRGAEGKYDRLPGLVSELIA